MMSSYFSPNIGGLETHLDGVCNYLAGKGHKVFVITYQPLTTKGKGLKVERVGNMEIHRIQWFGYNWRHKLERYPALLFLYEFPGLFISSFLFLLRHKKEVDVIDAQGLIPAFMAKILAKIFNKRSVVSVHAIFSFERHPIVSKVVKWGLSSFDVIMPFAQKTKDELVAIGLPEEKMKLYTSWVDLNIFRPLAQDKCKQELNLGGEFVVSFVGRLIEKKGVNVLLEAASKVSPNITFAFVGDGPLAGRLNEQAKIQPNIAFLGKMPNKETPKCYNAADVFVIPSQYEEQFGVVVLEALACGTPIIAANRGGIPEVMDSSVGIFIEPTAENIAQVVNHFYQNREVLARLAANCRPYAEARYSRDNMLTIEKAYDGEL